MAYSTPLAPLHSWVSITVPLFTAPQHPLTMVDCEWYSGHFCPTVCEEMDVNFHYQMYISFLFGGIPNITIQKVKISLSQIWKLVAIWQIWSRNSHHFCGILHIKLGVRYSWLTFSPIPRLDLQPGFQNINAPPVFNQPATGRLFILNFNGVTHLGGVINVINQYTSVIVCLDENILTAWISGCLSPYYFALENELSPDWLKEWKSSCSGWEL